MKINLLAALSVMSLLAQSPAMADEHPTRIAFVDTGNTGRSVTAEALAAAAIAKTQANAQFISRAIDLNPFNVHPEENFVVLLRERGIDIAPHLAMQFGPQDAKYADIILTMTATHKNWVIAHFPDAKDKVFTLAEYATGKNDEVLDAYGKPMNFYKTVLAQLDQLVAAAVAKATTKP